MLSENELFANALELPAAERLTYLNEVCAADASLRDRVLALLEAYTAADSFLDHPPINRPPTAAREKPGDQIGRYTLVRLLGEGGCGVVYLAEQTEPVRRQVALKVIKLGMDTQSVITRFDAERQALARMDHPDIARVYDADSTASGRPFFVMEYVAGVPITTYCDQQSLPLSARLELFARVCQAVQHAHQKGVIHRDLKPSNVLVTLREGVPVPKIIDFGIAKATEGRLTDATQHTALEQFVGTPAYMSPEQAELSALDVDTRSDIYSLGVLLYELLTGRTPFEARELLQAGFDAMRRHIREVEPPRPSTRLHTLDVPGLAAIAQHRQVAPPQLVHLVKGDLDWIVMRCLEKERDRRYDSAAALADDLRRHLRHEAIEARPAGSLYRLQKFVRRNRLAVTAGAAVVIALVSGVVVSTWQARRAARAEAEAHREAAAALAVNQFLIDDLLRQADSSVQANDQSAAKPNLTVREALDRAAAKAGERFAAQPELEATVRLAIGQSYIGISAPTAAVENLRRAWDLRREQLGPEQVATLQAGAELGRALTLDGKLAEAEALQTEVLALQAKVLGPDDLALDDTRNALAETLEIAGKYNEEETLHRQTLEHRKARLGPDHPDTLASMENLGNAFYYQGKFAEAADLQQQSLDGRERVLGPNHPATLSSLNNLSVSLARLNRYDESIVLQKRALALSRQIMGPEHFQTLVAMVNLAGGEMRLKDFAAATELLQQTLEISERVMGPEHNFTLTVMNNLCTGLSGVGRVEESLALQKRLLTKLERVLGAEHPNTLSTLGNLGHALSKQGHYAEAQTHLLRAYDGLSRVLGPAHPTTLTVKTNLAVNTTELGDLPQAETLWAELVAAQMTKHGADSPLTQFAQNHLIDVLTAEEKFAEAEPIARAVWMTRQASEPERWTTFNAQSVLGGILIGLARYDEAETALLVAEAGLRAHVNEPPDGASLRLRETVDRLIALYTARDRPEAIRFWQQQRQAPPTAELAPTS